MTGSRNGKPVRTARAAAAAIGIVTATVTEIATVAVTVRAVTVRAAMVRAAMVLGMAPAMRAGTAADATTRGGRSMAPGEAMALAPIPHRAQSRGRAKPGRTLLDPATPGQRTPGRMPDGVNRWRGRKARSTLVLADARNLFLMSMESTKHAGFRRGP